MPFDRENNYIRQIREDARVQYKEIQSVRRLGTGECDGAFREVSRKVTAQKDNCIRRINK